MNLSFEALEPGYAKALAACKKNVRGNQDNLTSTIEMLMNHKDHFVSLQAQCGVPAIWVMPVFYREGPDFNTYLGNGDPLDKPTTDVPHDRGPFSTWIAGAIDALNLDHVTACESWTWEAACFEWERWNGFGPREHGRMSGYLWSGTNQYHGGKYISDGVWSRGTWDEQLGCVIIAQTLAALDADLAKGFIS